MIKKVTVSHEIEIKIIDEEKFNDSVKSYIEAINSQGDENSVLKSIAYNYSIDNTYCIDGIGSLDKNSDIWCGVEIVSHEIDTELD